jgi:DNA processing protein
MTDSPAPPIPAGALPRSADEAIDWLRLIRSRRVGPSTFRRLLADHGSAAAALDALPGVAAAAGVANYLPVAVEVAQQEYEAGRKSGARLICLGGAHYPAALAEIGDAPPLLWVRGRLDLLARDGVALVGARNASSLGTRMAKLLARDLGTAGFVITSGLARGIDAAAHAAALDTGTIAVMAGGLDQIYPPENRKLTEAIFAGGLALSEHPPALAPQARHFPRRNRLVSGLCRGVVVVEAALKSGSLITARDAADQGREVMAVPGHPLDTRASGCSALIRDGATLVRSAADVIEALALPGSDAPVPVAPAPAEPPKASIAEALNLSRRILSLIGPTPVAEDQIIRDLNLPAQDVSRELVTLELEGKLSRKAGGMLSLVV